MTRKGCTTKRRKFQHLTKEKRAQIEILLRQKLPKVQIARAVGILRGYRAYFWDAGLRVYEGNRTNCRPAFELIRCYDFIQYAQEQILESKIAPDAIRGEAKLNGRCKRNICTKMRYNSIDRCLPTVGNISTFL